MQKLTDKDFMKFGKYAGKRLEDIPAKYFLWLRDSLSDKKVLNLYERKLWEYIQDNMDCFEQEMAN